MGLSQRPLFHEELYHAILVALKLVFRLSLEKFNDSLLKRTAQNSQKRVKDSFRPC